MPSFARSGNSFLEGALREAAPATGTTVVLNAGEDVFFSNSATIAALTLQLPGGFGRPIDLKFRSIVTALTFKDAIGTTVSGGGLPTAATAGQKTTIRRTSVGWGAW